VSDERAADLSPEPAPPRGGRVRVALIALAVLAVAGAAAAFSAERPKAPLAAADAAATLDAALAAGEPAYILIHSLT
jgi:hypothetical protein